MRMEEDKIMQDVEKNQSGEILVENKTENPSNSAKDSAVDCSSSDAVQKDFLKANGNTTEPKESSSHSFKCEKCSFASDDKVLFDGHVCQKKTAREARIEIKCEGEKFLCGECDFTAQGPGFEEHLMCHLISKPYQCIYCKESFVNRKEIGRHVAVAHKGMKMNCALKAMKKAKSFMAETRKSGTFTFIARVSGKVPSGKASDFSKSSYTKTNVGSTVPSSSDDFKTATYEASNEDSASALNKTLFPKDPTGDPEKTNALNKNEKPVVSEDSPQANDGDNIAEQIPATTVSEVVSSGEKDTPVISKKVDENKISLDVGSKIITSDSLSTYVKTNESSGEKSTETEDSTDAKASSMGEQPENLDEIPASENHQNTSEKIADDFDPDTGTISESVNHNLETTYKKPMEADNKNEKQPFDEKESTFNSSIEVNHNPVNILNSDKTFNSISKSKNDPSKSTETSLNSENDLTKTPDSHMETDEPNEPISSLDISRDINLEGTSESSTSNPNETSPEITALPNAMADSTKDLVDCNLPDFSSEPTQKFSLETNGEPDTHFKNNTTNADTESTKEMDETNLHSNGSNESFLTLSKNVNEESARSEPICTETAETMETISNVDDNAEDMNLKIIASFSLNDCQKADESTDIIDRAEGETDKQTTEYEPPKPPPLLSVQEVMASIIRQNKLDHFYACGFQCDFSCLNSAEFREHLQIEHFGSTTYPCCHCGWTTDNVESLLKHVTGHAHAYNKTVPLYFCGVSRCRFGTNIMLEFINHMNILHPDLLQFNCKECGAVFHSTLELVQHFEDNYLHVVNCPHCCSKAQNRHVILNHISEAHPGKPKMLSVGKQIICKERKVNSFHQLKGLISNMRRSRNSLSNLEHILNLEVPQLFNGSETTEKDAHDQSLSDTQNTEYNTDNSMDEEDNEESFVVKSEILEDNPSPASSGGVPENARETDNLKCNYCTFVAKDNARLNRHQTCHSGSGDGRQQAKKQRFKCPYCPQCFENLTKFGIHVSCHPGLIKYTLLTCKHCEFNSNQKHNMIRHIESRCGRNYVGCSEDLYFETEKFIESKVLECENCNYQTRHKIHLKSHRLREHNISSSSSKGNNSSSIQSEKITELNTEEMSVLRSPPASSSRENLQKKFMCPVCFYLLPKGADLKKHIRKHPELGKVSLILFRCRYCSCASTAKHVIAGHIKDKHPGRDVALVKKIISVDTREHDNTFSETQVSETPVSIPESEVSMMLQQTSAPPATPALSKLIEDAIEINETYYHVFIVPEYSKGNFNSPVNCPCCEFLSYAASPFIQHLKIEHPKVCIIGRQTKPVQKYYKLGNSIPFGLLTLLHSAAGLKQEVVVLSHKDVFGVSAQCPKCVFSTYFKQNLALHIRDHHRELSILESHKEDFKSPEKLSNDTLPPLPPLPTKAEETLAKLQELRKQDPIIVGSGILDDKLKGLYENLGFVSRCAICGTERPKRYHMHVHVLRHLNVSLWKCQYCDYKGLERYKMCKHIKDQHPQKKMAIKYLPVDIEETITEYLNERSAAAAAGIETPGPKMSPSAKYSMDAAFSPLGNDDLDEHLKELYREDGEIFYCILCSFTVRRKFAIHRHLVSSHLAIALVGCGYCGFRGIDRKSIIDHSHEQHNQSTLNVILLPNDLKKIVSDCLSSSGLKEDEETTPIAEPTVQFQEELPKPKQKARKSFPTPKPVSIPVSQLPDLPETENSVTESTGPKKYVMGTEALDLKLRVLFSVNGGTFKCSICEASFPRRYAIHRHLLMSHLKVGLMQCPLCSFSGVERYLVMKHLKDHHKVENQIPFPCAVDMDAKISEFLNTDLSQNKSHLIPRRKPNFNKNSGTPSSSSPMVVALFNKRKISATKEEVTDLEDPLSKKIKQEVDDDRDSADAGTPSPISSKGDDDDQGEEAKPEEHWEANSDNVSLRQPRGMVDVGTKINVLNLSRGHKKKFGCERCSFTSVHRSNVQRHVFRVHEKYRYKICKICGYRTLSNVLIRQHIQDKHTDATDGDIEYEKLVSDRNKDSSPTEVSGPTIIQGLYACAYCSFETNTSDNIVKHMEQEHPKTASVPEEKPKKVPVLKIPLLPATNPGSPRKRAFSCDLCNFKCSIYRLLKSHVALAHKNVPKAEESLPPKPTWKYACVECHLKMDVATKMKCHIGRHFNYKPYVCETCSADFASPDEMRKHIRRYLHSEKINYVKDDAQEERLDALLIESKKYALDIMEGKCPNLNPNRVGQRIVRKKTQTMTQAEMEASTVPQKRQINDLGGKQVPAKQVRVTGGFGCSKCDFTSQSINDVSTHHMRAHRNKTFLWRDLVMGYLCDVNGKVVESEGPPQKKKAVTFKTSTVGNTPWHTCSKCGFNTSHLQGMVGHVKAHGTRDYLCAYCCNRYFKRAMLNRHQKSIHKGKRIWIIHQTNDDSEPMHSSVGADDTEDNIDYAEPLSANTNMNYCCHLCDFKADSLYQYRLHLPSHGDCGQLVPDLAVESPLKCGYCAYVATDQRDFSAHITIHLNDRTYKCFFCEYSSYNRKDVQSHLLSKHSNEGVAQESKYIISSKDMSTQGQSKTNESGLPMLANLDPRVVLEPINSKDFPKGLKRLSSVVDVSSAFQILESEMGASTDSEPNDDKSNLMDSENASEISLSLDDSSVADSETVSIGDGYVTNLSLDVLEHVNSSTTDISASSKSDVEVFDNIDKALEQLNHNSDKDTSKTETRT